MGTLKKKKRAMEFVKENDFYPYPITEYSLANYLELYTDWLITSGHIKETGS